MKLNIKPLIAMARRFASSMGEKSGQVRTTKKNQVIVARTKQKIVDGAIETLPLGNVLKGIMERQGISAEEIFVTLQDENFIKGIQVLIKTFSGLAGKITGRTDKNEQTAQQGVMQ